MSCRASLHALLTAHVTPDAGEQQHRARMLALLVAPRRRFAAARHQSDVPGDPFRRDHFVPGHFTASAFVLAPERDAILLVHHRKLDCWVQPGGHIDASDADVLAAARREVLEETGIAELELVQPGTFDVDVHAIPQLGPEPPHEHFDVRFLFAAPSRAVRVSHESKAVRWVPLSEIGAAGVDESVLRAARKLTKASGTAPAPRDGATSE